MARCSPPFTSGYTVNSPPETFPLSGISIPPGWDYYDTYHVLVSHLAFGANGFGGVTIPIVHNSPPKIGVNQTTPSSICHCIINTAVATGTIGTTTVSATASETVCPSSGTGGGSCPTAGTASIKDKRFKWPMTNSGTSTATVTGITVTWPAVNGKLMKMKFDGDVMWDKGSAAGVTMITIPESDLTTDSKKKTIDPGKTRTFILEFEKNASTTLSAYTVSVSFGPNCTVTFP